MDHLTVRTETETTYLNLLELAANNDVEEFREAIERDPSCVDDTGFWYCHEKGSRKMVLERRTPLMVAATYGSIEIVKLILSLSVSDVNRSCGRDGSTALHCAATGGSPNAATVVRILLSAGADPNILNAKGLKPNEVICVPPKPQEPHRSLEELLVTDGSFLSPTRFGDAVSIVPMTVLSEKKEYPVDPSLPDIKNSIYATDEFRMFSFKVRPCSRAYSHDWTECPFVHPGENARRRDPRKYHYSCVPCPDFRKGVCRRGDMCEYAHGVFECWLHPAQYRTRLCKDGTGCNRRVCFFAHTADELRPLYVSTGSAMPSPRAIDIAAAMSLLPASPSSPFTPPMSPSGSSQSWCSSVPMLHLPGANAQSSRLRSSLNARDYNGNGVEPDGMSAYLPRRSLNLDELFSGEACSSPRFSDQSLAVTYSPTHKSAVMNSQFHLQQSLLSPINTAGTGSSLLRAFSNDPISPMRKADPFRGRDVMQGGGGGSVFGSPSWSPKWAGGAVNGKADWGPGWMDDGRVRRAASLEGFPDEPDLSWVQSLVKESTPEVGDEPPLSPCPTEPVDHAVLRAWLDQMQLDQLAAK